MINISKYIISTKFSNTKIDVKKKYSRDYKVKLFFVYIVYFVYTCVRLYINSNIEILSDEMNIVPFSENIY